MIVYLDLCCIKRPFDDASDARMQAETSALATILAICSAGGLELMTSDALRFENERNPNEDRREYTNRVLALARHNVGHSFEVERMAAQWQADGVSLLDALHLASAELGHADVFATTDDVLIRRSRRRAVPIRIVSLMELLQEVSS